MSKTLRTAIVPLWLSRQNHQYFHDGSHASALFHNTLVNWLHEEWRQGRNPDKWEIVRYANTIPGPPTHAHNRQAVSKDLAEAVETARTARAHGHKARTPYKTKQYRSLTFSRHNGWTVHKSGKLSLSFGRGHRNVLVPLPEVIDSVTGKAVQPSLWREMQACWDTNAREWTLHIPYETEGWTGMSQAVQDKETGEWSKGTVTIAIDEGIIHAMALTCHRGDRVDALVISNREARAVKRWRNKTVGKLDRKIARTKEGSRRNRRLQQTKKGVKAKAARQLRDLDHKVTSIADDFIRDIATDKETGEIYPVRPLVGDVAGIEKNTRKNHRGSRSLRQQLSQWSRGKQELYLAYKTGLVLEKISERGSTQACPKCTTMRKTKGRIYVCKNPDCRYEIHRDVNGSGNIGSLGDNGGVLTPWVTDSTHIVVTYQRATHHWTPVQKAQHAHYDALRGRSGVRVVKHVVADRDRSLHTSDTVGLVVAEARNVSHPTTNP